MNVFNHCSTYVADVVWTGLSTQHIRQGLEEHIDLDRLREAWMAISPVNYLDKFASRQEAEVAVHLRRLRHHVPSGALTRHRRQDRRHSGVDHKVVVLPCGHYTLGETPFKFIDGYHICSFLKRHL